MHRLVGRTYDEVVGKDGHLTQYYMFDLAKGADGTIGIYAYYVYRYTLMFGNIPIHIYVYVEAIAMGVSYALYLVPLYVYRWGGGQGGLQRRERRLPTLRAARHVRTTDDL